ncbi:MAG TPA: ATP-binding cassette domain-containing protein [Solirubrobacterales bacterium]
MNDNSAIVARGLSKRYDELWALRDIDLNVPAGSVLGLLGHNGAGKTTAIRILTTLAEPTSGSASVAGFDVATEGARVRERIGVAGQSATVDDLLTARANLEMVGRLYHLPKGEVRSRADELLERLGLADVGDRLVKTFSGGMRRRLDLAASLVADPPVLFLDEPTTGLDPEARIELWKLLRELVAGGTTLLLTTQYLDEADQLADSIVVLDRGRVIEEGSPAELKSRVGGERVVINVSGTQEIPPAASALARFADGHIDSDPGELLVAAPVQRGTRLIEVVRALDQEGIDAADVHRREPTLDDVFLALTGTRRVESDPTDEHELEEVAA